MPHRAPTRSGGPATRRSSGPSACGVGSWSTSTGSALPSRTRNACDWCATCASRCGGGERRGTVRSSFGIAAVAWSRCANRTSSSAAGTGTGCRGSCPRGRSDPLSWRHTPWICCGSSIRPRRAPSPFWRPAARRGRASRVSAALCSASLSCASISSARSAVTVARLAASWVFFSAAAAFFSAMTARLSASAISLFTRLVSSRVPADPSRARATSASRSASVAWSR